MSINKGKYDANVSKKLRVIPGRGRQALERQSAERVWKLLSIFA